VTIADIKVQKTIESNLKHLYPSLKIQGEESKESTDTVESAVKPEQLTDSIKHFVSQ
jgi:3'-phosphoadenosine 5'-phosphosulfate (PAPS) 3'-phosphatase